jgi:exodeoxyribonuclease VII large subunit
MKSVLWRDDYISINSTFLREIKEPLKDGVKILFLAKITFDPEHGLALRILDIDPSYTLGDLEKEKTETIRKLKSEGIFFRNKTLSMPLLPQRIAIISAETSKGYSDFRKVIDENGWNYRFFHLLFPSLLQGDKGVESMMQQLDRIRKVSNHFDVVAIIRGGGGDVGLSCYNNYELSKAVALFPLPMLTGIGHSTNETVVEMVAHENAITPTKLGEFLLQKFHNFAVPLQKAEEKIAIQAKKILQEEKSRFNGEIRMFRSATSNHMQVSRNLLMNNSFIIRRESRHLIQHSRLILDHQIRQLDAMAGNTMIGEGSRLLQLAGRTGELSRRDLREKSIWLENLSRQVEILDPKNVLRRGYSITLKGGKPVKDPGGLTKGDILETLVAGGKISSEVQSTETDQKP